MHEIGVLYKMLEQVEAVAKEHNVKKVKSIEIELGELSGMLPVFFEQYYEAATENKSLFKGSELIVKTIPGEGLCLDCKTLYNIMNFEGQCPKCKSRNKKILGGRDFVVKNILVEADDAPISCIERKMKMAEIKLIELKQSVFADNNADADRLRNQLKEEKTFLLNLMSSPGSGKTTTLLALAKELEGRIKWGVMEADIDSAVDTETMIEAGIPSIQLHTGGMCHLDADMTRQGLNEFGTKDLDFVVLENVGNLVCPAEFDTGAVKNMTILSVPEGHDKPLKYPLMYETCDLLVINKIDVMPYFDFDKDKVVEYAKMRNPEIEIIFVSAKTGEGMDQLADWILKNVKEWC